MIITEADREKARAIYEARYARLPSVFSDDDPMAASYRNSMAHIEDIATAIAPERERADRYKAALEEIAAILGTGKCRQPDCEGCQYERESAADTAREALE